MPLRDIVVIGASAGGISALQRLIHALPADFSAAILVVLHISRQSTGLLPDILARSGVLPARNAQQGEPIRNGHIYVAPPDRHLLAGPGRKIQIGNGPKENRFRPAVDPLFRSAALNYGSNVIGVVLSGWLDDGTAGLCTIKQAGGLVVIQDPEDAEVPSMPRSALRHVPVDFCLTADKIGEMLPRLVRQATVAEKSSMSGEIRLEVELAADERNRTDLTSLGEPSVYTCPACAGSLLRVREPGPVRFRCHTGHAYTALSLDDELRGKVEDTTWGAIRALQEHAMLLREMNLQQGFSQAELAGYRTRAELALRRADVLRDALALEEGDAERNAR